MRGFSPLARAAIGGMLFGVLASSGPVGCSRSKDVTSQAPGPEVVANAGIDDLERMLAENETRLEAQGVRIATLDLAGGARAQPADDSDVAPPNPESEPESDASESSREESEAAQPIEAAPPEPAPSVRKEAMRGPDAAQRRKNRAATQRCTTICVLASSTCGIEQQICRLADEHNDETRYRDSCERASLDCDVSVEACRACTD